MKHLAVSPAKAAAAVLAKYPGAVNLWLPANTLNGGGTQATVGQSIKTWTDTGGAANNGTQTNSGNQPVLQTVKGMLAVAFPGPAYFTLASASWDQASDSFSLVGANNNSTTVSGGQYIMNPSGAGPSGALAYAGNIIAIWGGSSPGYSTPDLTVPMIIGGLRRGTNGYLRGNGTVLNTTTGISGSGSGSFGALGAYQNNVTLNGNIWCALGIKGTVTDADALTLERWFNTMTPTGVSF